MASEKVKEFCKKFHAELVRGYWGDMEPEIFQNIAEGNTMDESGEGLVHNHIDNVEMAEAVEAMEKILEKIL